MMDSQEGGRVTVGGNMKSNSSSHNRVLSIETGVSSNANKTQMGPRTFSSGAGRHYPYMQQRPST